jgi:hypothetical protein
MELQEALAAYGEQITRVLSRSPAATDDWVRETTASVMAPMEAGAGDHLSRADSAEPSL